MRTSPQASVRGWWLLPLALVSGPVAADPATSPPTSTESLAERLSAIDWMMTPRRASVPVGGEVPLYVGQHECIENGLICSIVPKPRPEGVSRWRVNGVDGGNAEVGTVSRGAGDAWVYHAPGHVPGANPVSVAAIIDGARGGQLQLVSEITVVPTGWSGTVRVGFQSSHNRQGEARHESALHDDAMYTTSGMPAFEIQRLMAIGGDIERVSFEAAYSVNGAMVEAFSDDGSGLAMLQLDIPAVAFSYDRVQKAGSSLGCRYTLGNSSVTEVDGGADLAQYASMPPSPLTFTLNADGTSTITAIPPALTLLSGQTVDYACDGDVGVGDIGPQMEALGDTSALVAGVAASGRQAALELENPLDGTRLPVAASEATVPLPGAFRGRVGQRGVYAGDLLLPGVMTVMGSPVEGVFRISWDIRRPQR